MGDNAPFDPRRTRFIELYTNPRSETFSNAYRSALTAGFSKDYAENITSVAPEWFKEIVGDVNRLKKAEKVFDKFLESDSDEDAC